MTRTARADDPVADVAVERARALGRETGADHGPLSAEAAARVAAVLDQIGRSPTASTA